MKNTILTLLAVVTLAACVDQEALQADVDDVFTRPFVPNAPGCEIRSPNGVLINHRFKDVGSHQNAKVLIEGGSTFNGDCFPDPNMPKS